ncbi:AraC family transcriptional regulator [Domibacillus sp. DTU_2020_1001157_1_SI_ALB_TIR_016]|uniref:helix-turn-helix transcriptional regulator n=1 Tax=Domibacillus sp. DTU_2020_1001157_1_SI_ALB_TIR_016 TaxID=3077789 RepID=UPI0028E806A2|nr:AraC family transcriptional regulator [Domibacillus sp. DTU_2020_1001157_1_SI_ALB_TIR_016]WNS78764.1 AraC family transcriptional regulator [Domibacillus sp. DTU_2020_1001157_1_SI_ALB_TIR_016]
MKTESLYRPELRTIDAYPKVNAYYFVQWDEYQMDFHAHREIEIMYVIHGTCVIEMKDEAVTMHKGDFILIDAGVAHRLIVEKQQPCRVLNMEFIFKEGGHPVPSIRQLADSDETVDRFLSMDLPHILLKDSCELSSLLQRIVLEMDQKKNGQDMMFHLMFAQMIVLIARLADEQRNDSVSSNSYIKEALNYLHQHYDCDIQVKDIASVVNLHPGYFHRIFKQHIGCTVMEYLLSVRMDKAKMLLSDTNISISDVPDYVGINSIQYFSALFKKHSQETPLSYRRKHQTIRNMIQRDDVIVEHSS